MKKLLRGMSIAFAFVMLLVLVSCKGSHISQSYADKINKAAEEGNHITYEEVKKALGDYGVDNTTLGTGTMYAIKGCKNDLSSQLKFIEKIADKPDTKISVITINFVGGKATSAVFASGKASDVDF